MLVKDWMSKTVITIEENDSMQNAIYLLKHHHIRMLPVLGAGKCVGVITDRDLKRTSASDATSLEIHELLYIISKIKVQQIMTKDPITVPLDYTVEETAEILLKNKISGVPVVDHDKNLVGVITQTDLFRLIISLTGVGKRGMQFALRLEDKAGAIKEVDDVIRAHGGRMVSILTSDQDVPDRFHTVYIRMHGIDRLKMGALKEKIMEKGKLIYIVDHVGKTREIYE